MKNRVVKFVEKEVNNDLTYNDMKDKINVSQYITEKKPRNKFVFRLASSLCLILLLITGFAIINQERIVYSDNDIKLFNNDNDFISSYDYVFIGKVTQELEVKQYDGTGTDIPYTFYNIEIYKYLKGEGTNTGKLCSYGGVKYLNTIELCEGNDELILVDNTYLFTVNKKSENSTNLRIDQDDYIITTNYQKILLDGYEYSKEMNDQTEKIQLVVNRFNNIINKVTDFNTTDLNFNTIEEMVDYYDYAFIAKVNSLYRDNNFTTDVTTANYKITGIVTFKENSTNFPTELLYYGINYWYSDTEADGIQLPINDGIYLIFASCNPDNSNELLMMSNHQQIYLADYNEKELYKDQDSDVLELIREYTQYIDNLDEKNK